MYEPDELDCIVPVAEFPQCDPDGVIGVPLT
jgi:hypothetical protein